MNGVAFVGHSCNSNLPLVDQAERLDVNGVACGMLTHFRGGRHIAIARAADVAGAGVDECKIASGKHSDQRRCDIGKPIRELKRECATERRFGGKSDATGRRLEGGDIDRRDDGAPAVEPVGWRRREVGAERLERSQTVV